MRLSWDLQVEGENLKPQEPLFILPRSVGNWGLQVEMEGPSKP